jgi:hypothetical protein
MGNSKMVLFNKLSTNMYILKKDLYDFQRGEDIIGFIDIDLTERKLYNVIDKRVIILIEELNNNNYKIKML